MKSAILLLFVATSVSAQTNLVVNGGFEDNGGLGGSGSWLVQNGTHPSGTFDCKDDVVQPPPSGFAAMSTQSDPGRTFSRRVVELRRLGHRPCPRRTRTPRPGRTACASRSRTPSARAAPIRRS